MHGKALRVQSKCGFCTVSWGQAGVTMLLVYTEQHCSTVSCVEERRMLSQ